MRPTELPSGVIAMGARTYIPQLGRFLQTDPQPGGSANAYTYTHGDPINASDPSGEFTYGVGESEEKFISQTGHEDTVKAEAEAKTRGACPIASMCTPPEESRYVDPNHDFYFTSEEAQEIGDILLFGGLAAKEELEELLGPVGAGIADLATSITEHISTELINCSKQSGAITLVTGTGAASECIRRAFGRRSEQ